LTFRSCHFVAREARDESSLAVLSLPFKHTGNGCIEAAVNELVTPSEFELSAELLVPRIVPRGTYHAARNGADFWDE
jgi:hypothetical protein